jgi:hypothetical protein
LKVFAKQEDDSSPYPPHLRPSNFHLYRSLQDALQGRHFAEEELKYSKCKEFPPFSKEFYADSI